MWILRSIQWGARGPVESASARCYKSDAKRGAARRRAKERHNERQATGFKSTPLTPPPSSSKTVDPMIRVVDVTKSYGDTVAVQGVSFDVAAGEVVGFLGPNGAGKSTLLKMISTWHSPDRGKIQVAGFDTTEAPLAVRQNLGYLPEHNALWDTMTVDRLLRFIGTMRGLSGAQLAQRRAWVVDRCKLSSVLQKRVNECSKGFRQRIGVAGALLHDPPVVLLDEPTHGLDPMQVVAFRDFIRELATMPITSGSAAGTAGRAVLFSSHILAEVAAISDRILVIREGKLLLDERTEVLKDRAAAKNTTLEELVVGQMAAQGKEVGQ